MYGRLVRMLMLSVLILVGLVRLGFIVSTQPDLVALIIAIGTPVLAFIMNLMLALMYSIGAIFVALLVFAVAHWIIWTIMEVIKHIIAAVFF